MKEKQKTCSICGKELTYWKTSLRKIEGKKICTKCGGDIAKKELKKTFRPNENIMDELGGDRMYAFGKYLYGLKESSSYFSAKCIETENDFVFVSLGKELGKIPVNTIKGIWVDDKSQITSRFTATRIATLGIFALAAKKKKTLPSYYLTVEWGTGGLSNNTIFEFSSITGANVANNHLREKISNLPEVDSSEEAISTTPIVDIPSQIEKLAEMKEKGILTKEEFEKKKKELLERM